MAGGTCGTNTGTGLISLRAHQMVLIAGREGEEIRCHWMLSRQVEGEFKDRWMTSVVVAAEAPVQREFVNIRRGAIDTREVNHELQSVHCAIQSTNGDSHTGGDP